MTTRKQYTKESKLAAIGLVVDQGLTIAEAAGNLEMNADMLRRWIKENQADNNDQVFRGNGKLTQNSEHPPILPVVLRLNCHQQCMMT